jgi:hypothetical protein
MGLTPKTRALLNALPIVVNVTPPPLHPSGCTDLLLTYLPDFCWLTFRDIISMLELIDPLIAEDTLSAALSRLHKAGKIVSKKYSGTIHPGGGGPLPLLYRKADGKASN